MAGVVVLLGPPFASFSAKGFVEYVKGLRLAAPKKKASVKKPFEVISVRENKKGTLVIRIRRTPKRITKEELKDMAMNWHKSYTVMYNEMKKRKIEVVDSLDSLDLTERTLPF